LKSIYEEFVCPICFEAIKNCRMTPCGHNYCATCLDDCLNLRHVCPVCSRPCTVDVICENKQFDRLLVTLEREKDKASKAYFDNLISGGGNTDNNTGNDNSNPDMDNTRGLSPIEVLFQRHMRKSLSNYQSYYESLKQRHDVKKRRLADEYATRPGDQEFLQRDLEFQYQLLDLNFDKSINLLLDSYNQYMENVNPSPEFLPVTATVIIVSKDITLYGVSIERTWTITDLKSKVKDRMEVLGDPVVQFSESNVFVLFKSGESDRNILNDGIIINDEHVPILQYNPEPGCILELRGNLICTSDAPKQCFKTSFQEGTLMDYYQCLDCQGGKLKWICKSCSEVCHAGHRLKPFLIGHTPEWACCYCERGRSCQLFQR